MYTKVTQKELAEVLDYYRQDRKNCLYSYIDLKKYGLGNPHLSVYIDRGLVTDARILLILCRLKRCTIF